MPTTYAIPNGRTVMDATTYSGTGSGGSYTNTDQATTGFVPDLTWVKNRSSGVYWNVLFDTVRGAGNQLSSNQTDAELASASNVAGKVSAFNSNGFTLAAGSGSINSVNGSGSNYVAWQWNAGSNTTVSNTSGSITSSVSANATAGFSIVTYTGTGASATVGHGLGVAPKFIIYKVRSTTGNWLANIGAITGTQGDYTYLNLTDAKLNSANVLNGNATTFSLLTSPENNANGATFVAYCWAQVAGFSQFGSYTGNGSTDGPFVYTGFRPKFVLVKRTNGTSYWVIFDSSRNAYNLADLSLSPNVSDAEFTNLSNSQPMDLLSNGFKLRGTGNGGNGSGDSYIYAAFAENPFKYANAR